MATGAGRRALVLPRALPTPVLAHAVRALGRLRRRDGDGQPQPAAGQRLQGLPRRRAGRAGRRRRADRAAGRRRDRGGHPGGRAAGRGAARRARRGARRRHRAVLCGRCRRGRRPGPGRRLRPRNLAVAYTPMHGVGADVLAAAFEQAGFAHPATVAEQVEPDPAFPTVAFPNPEEPGAMDLVLALAESAEADLAIANDPDADRCAVAVPVGGPGAAGLADAARRRGRRAARRPPDAPRRPGPATPPRSSRRPCCGRCAPPAGLAYGETLTGFKWIVRAGGPTPIGSCTATRRRSGYCVAPRPRPRQGRHHRRAAGGRAGRRAQGGAAHARPTGSTSWPASSASTPPTSSRCASTT